MSAKNNGAISELPTDLKSIPLIQNFLTSKSYSSPDKRPVAFQLF
jgi:hypothetical protein